jgi:hypothetical protein
MKVNGVLCAVERDDDTGKGDRWAWVLDLMTVEVHRREHPHIQLKTFIIFLTDFGQFEIRQYYSWGLD